MNEEEILLNEFGCYYLADELPSIAPEHLASWLPAWAQASAQRLSADAGAEGTPRLLELLRAVRADRDHPLVARLSRESNIPWRDDDAWPGLQAILDEIGRHLEPEAPSA